ncbi:Hypothetical predicted protein [Octopus vulgaris]|uniref:Uncharacterized protein n=1 Tax=Octopus vulgaris TaxID=6645 RepID=A0AA36B4S8_OCTVU|nr:Hypothetical predicted protein [Octopus vulgaris]
MENCRYAKSLLRKLEENDELFSYILSQELREARNMKSWRILCFVILLITMTAADDQLLCCMKGVKRMRKAVFCSEPCCSGYIERVENPPLLGLVVFCEKLEV